MNINIDLFEMRQTLIHREKQLITKIEIDYLKQMNKLLRDKEAAIKKIKAQFSKDRRVIEQILMNNNNNNSPNPLIKQQLQQQHIQQQLLLLQQSYLSQNVSTGAKNINSINPISAINVSLNNNSNSNTHSDLTNNSSSAINDHQLMYSDLWYWCCLQTTVW